MGQNLQNPSQIQSWIAFVSFLQWTNWRRRLGRSLRCTCLKMRLRASSRCSNHWMLTGTGPSHLMNSGRCASYAIGCIVGNKYRCVKGMFDWVHSRIDHCLSNCQLFHDWGNHFRGYMHAALFVMCNTISLSMHHSSTPCWTLQKLVKVWYSGMWVESVEIGMV